MRFLWRICEVRKGEDKYLNQFPCLNNLWNVTYWNGPFSWKYRFGGGEVVLKVVKILDMHCMILASLGILCFALPSLFKTSWNRNTEWYIHLLYQLQKTGNWIYWCDCPTNLINSERKKGITLRKALLLCISLEEDCIDIFYNYKTTKFLKTSWVSNCLY